MKLTKNRNGFTAIELILGIVMGVVVASIAYTLMTPAQNWFFTEARRGGMSAGESAMMRMIKEVRMVKDSSSITINPAVFTFTDYNNNTISYSMSGTDLMRNTSILARGVSNLSFAYLDKDGNATAVSADVRQARISFDLVVHDQTIHLRSAALTRNVQ